MYRNELGFSFIACVVAACRHWQQKHPFREICTNALLCAAVAFGANNLLELFGIDGSKWGYLASVAIGYMGLETTLGVISDRIPFIKRKGEYVPTKQHEPEEPKRSKSRSRKGSKKGNRTNAD
ncbi:TPA: phage holin family protein [Klebsiella aerogenes]|nr:phage holin family protein [Klebsiella aerogenes]